MIRDGIEKTKKIKKRIKHQKRVIKLMRTKLDIKIKWYKILRDEINKKLKIQKNIKSNTNSN